MANIFQKIFLPKSQWMILDFIDKNADSINYSIQENQWYTWHNLDITGRPDFTLHTSLRRDNDRYKPTDHVTYSFKCNKSEKCENTKCPLAHKNELNGFASIGSDGIILWESFALRVHNEILSAYHKRINKQRIPCNVK